MATRIFQKLHEIKLEDVKVLELFIKSKQLPAHTVGIGPEQFSLRSEHTTYDAESKSIRVRATVETGMDDKSKAPFALKVQIVGFFSVDDEKFDVRNIDNWAKKNAPMILYPFVREQVYALTARCGFEPVILPLVVLPTLVPKKKAVASARGEIPASQSSDE